MSVGFTIGDISFELEFRKVKALRLTVYPKGGSVKIYAPPGTTLAYAREFAASKISWVEKHRLRFLVNAKTDQPLQNGSTVFVWGKAYKLEITERKGHPKILPDGEILKMYVRPLPPENALLREKKNREQLDKWFRKILTETAEPLIKKWEAIIGVKVKKLYTRKMKSCWGSCKQSAQTMRLNSELAKRSAECLEYVIVHEMLHIIERSHNKNYYYLLNKYFPDWKRIRKKMNTGEL